MKRISRRAFLRLGLISGIALAAGVTNKATESVGFSRWIRWITRGYATRWFGPRPRVALVSCPAYDENVLLSIEKAWQYAGMPDLRGLRVVLKANLVDGIHNRPAYTHPRIIQALIHLARDMGAREITVAEGSAFQRDMHSILENSGYAEMLNRERVEFVDLNYDDVVSISLRGGYTDLKTLLVGRTITSADLVISVPKLKMHHWSTISASVKNLFGIVPGIKYGWPKNTLHMHGIPQSLVELADSLPAPICAVVDGVVGMQGDGPLFGTAVESGIIVAGRELVAVDATCARLMGVKPSDIEFLDFAAWAGVGTIDESKIDIVGEPLTRLKRNFQLPPLAG